MSLVLILGATSTVAIELSKYYANAGFDLILAARRIDRLNPLKSNLEINFKSKVFLNEFDVTQYDTHSEFYESLNSKPDIVICAFGILGSQEESEKNWNQCQDVIAVNFLGAVSILNIIARDFQSRKHGVIVGISSVAGLRGRKSNYIYGSAKAGFSTFLSGLRNRLSSYNVKVITILPGFIETKMTVGLDTPGILTTSADHAAKIIFQSVDKNKDIVYAPWYWRYIMILIRLIPEKFFKKLNL